MKETKIAIVADWIYGGGSEKVVEALHKLYPNAPIYTSYCSDEWRERLDNKVITGYLQRPPFKQLRKFLPLLRQWWFSKLDLSEYDIVISSSGNGESKFAKAPNGKHICYCHTPNHFYWRHYNEYLDNPGFKPKWLVRLGLKTLIRPLRKSDYKAAQRVDLFIANSSHIKNDIKTYYNRESEVIFPPVDISRFKGVKPQKAQRGFVTMGRQVPMKKLDLIIEACNQLNLALTVIGRGPEHDNLVDIAGPDITFKTDISDEQMPQELASHNAFIFASFEDFGIAPIEGLASGIPVIAYKAGGALDYIAPGRTGEFFEEQTIDSLKVALSKFNNDIYDENKIRTSVKKFDSKVFTEKLQRFIENANKN